MSSKIASLLFGLILMFAVRSFLRGRFEQAIKTVTSNGPASCLSLAGYSTRDEGRASYIAGSVKNSCDHKVDSVTVTFLVDSTMGSDHREVPVSAYARDVGPGETKEFKSVIPISRNASYRFDKITAF